MDNIKGQTALEYLMTYGWAIIIVVIVGIVLWKLGVGTPSVQKGATSFDIFAIGTDFKINSYGEATLILTNHDKQSRQITLQSVTIDNQDSCGVEAETRNPGETWEIICTDAPAGEIGTSYTGIQLSINYTVGGTNYSETGILSGKYE